MKTILKLFFITLVFVTSFSSCVKEKETVIVLQNEGNGNEESASIVGSKWIRVNDENNYIQFQTTTTGIEVHGNETFHFTYTYVAPEGMISGYEDEENMNGYYEIRFNIENNYLYVYDVSSVYTYIRS